MKSDKPIYNHIVLIFNRLAPYFSLFALYLSWFVLSHLVSKKKRVQNLFLSKIVVGRREKYFKLPENLMFSYNREKSFFLCCSLYIKFVFVCVFFSYLYFFLFVSVYSNTIKKNDVYYTKSKWGSHCSSDAFEMYVKLLKFGFGITRTYSNECVCIWQVFALSVSHKCQQWVHKM